MSSNNENHDRSDDTETLRKWLFRAVAIGLGLFILGMYFLAARVKR